MVEAFASGFDEDVFGIVLPDTAESFSQEPPSLTLTGVPEYGTPEESLGNLASFVEQQTMQGGALGSAAIESGDYRGIKDEDINKLRQDPRNVRDYYTESVDTNIVDFVEDNNIPLFKEVNGQKLYLNTGTSGSVAGIAKEGSDVIYQSFGPVGTYSTIAVPKERGIVASFPPIVRAALSYFTGGMSEAVLAGVKGLAGETLTTADWLNIARGTFNLYTQGSSGASGTGTGQDPNRTLEEMSQDSSSGVMSALGEIGKNIPENIALGGGTLDAAGGVLDAGGRLLDAYNFYEILIERATEGDVDFSELVPTGTIPSGSTIPQDTELGDLDKEPIVVDPIEIDIPPPVLPEEPTEAADSAAADAAQAAEAAEAGANAAAGFEDTGDTDTTTGTGDGDQFPDEDRGEGDSFQYDKDAFADVFGDLWLDADFDTLDANNDGVVAAEEMDEYERSLGDDDDDDDGLDLGLGLGLGNGDDDDDDDNGLDLGLGNGDDDDLGLGNGNGDDDDDLGTGTGTNGTDGTDGTVGTDGEDGERGAQGLRGLPGASATRTTDSLFGDMFQMKTKVEDTQKLVPFSLAPTPTLMPYNVPQVNPLEQFLQQRKQEALRAKPQGMLTNAELLERFPY